MQPVSCTDTHHDVADLLNHGMAKNTETWISWEWNITFIWKKIFLTCAPDNTFSGVIVLASPDHTWMVYSC